jgi:hypothetical protein
MLVFLALATLRWRALLQRRGGPDIDLRQREWRATVRQSLIVLAILASLIALAVGAIPKENFYTAVAAAIIGASLLTRFAVRRLPGFLQ